MTTADERAEFLHQNYGINHVTATVESWLAEAFTRGVDAGRRAERKATAERIAEDLLASARLAEPGSLVRHTLEGAATIALAARDEGDR